MMDILSILSIWPPFTGTVNPPGDVPDLIRADDFQFRQTGATSIQFRQTGATGVQFRQTGATSVEVKA